MSICISICTYIHIHYIVTCSVYTCRHLPAHVLPLVHDEAATPRYSYVYIYIYIYTHV